MPLTRGVRVGNLAPMPAAFEKPPEGYTLAWPMAQARTRAAARVDARYIYKLTFERYRRELSDELRRLGAINVVISCDLPLRADGMPYADRTEPKDPGVAVWFDLPDQVGTIKPYVIAIDRYQHVRTNVAALARTIEAFRIIDRHGSASLMQQAMGGFKMLPAHEANESWWRVLGLESTATAEDVARAYERLAQLNHPDRSGGSHDEMARINAARDRALRDLGGG